MFEIVDTDTFMCCLCVFVAFFFFNASMYFSYVLSVDLWLTIGCSSPTVMKSLLNVPCFHFVFVLKITK